LLRVNLAARSILKKAILGAVLPHEIASNHACCEPSGLGWEPTETANGDSAVASTYVSNFHRERQRVSPRSDVNCLDLDAILEENKQLRELVVQLSEIVVRNVLDRK
jgi:hypothetical protein